ncbi:MAG: MBL fold metallo-hydrolase [Anaerolineales bacterium]
MTRITPIKLRFSNAYFITGAQHTILVDTGMPGEETKILRAAQKAGIDPAQISLIFHTHGHVDHAGSSRALAAHLGIPTAIHPADADMLHSGIMRPLHTIGLEAKLILPMVNRLFPAFEPDVLIDETFNLSEYGIAGRILHIPGHTAGSVSILLENGAAIVGDVMMGGYLGGNLFATHPRYHYFAENFAQISQSIAALLTLTTAAQTFYVGHGGPLTRAAVEKQFSRI